MTSRGGGHVAGRPVCNAAVVIDTSRHMRAILEVDPEARLARVQPGVILDQLAKPQARHQPDLRARPRRRTPTHARRHDRQQLVRRALGDGGRTADNVDELEVADRRHAPARRADDDGGARAPSAPGAAAAPRSTARCATCATATAISIRAALPEDPAPGLRLQPRRRSCPRTASTSPARWSGSEGTCAAVLEATSACCTWPTAQALLVLGYPDDLRRGRPRARRAGDGPIGLEAIDQVLVDDMQRTGPAPARDPRCCPTGAGG